MSSIDDRIVSLKFDNQQFEQKIAATMASLDQLSAKIANIGTNQGFSQLATAANTVDLTNVANGVDKISGRFGALGAIAFSTIQQITQSFLSMAGSFIQTDILAPLITGGKTRAQNIEQAQFQFRGLGMNVEEVMANAKSAVLGTAYGLGDAAKAAAQFGASGISAGSDMTQSLRAIAGTAAMTGASYSEMAYLFTSSAAQNKITNMDLQQFATRGLNAAAAYGKQVGKTEAEVHQMATNGELDYKSFAAAMDAAFGQHATMANETYAGSLANMHAAMSRLSASFFGPEMQQQRDLFNALTPVIDKVSAAMQPLIKAFLDIHRSLTTGMIDALGKLDFSKLTFAMPNFAEGFRNIFDSLQQVFGLAKAAFKEIFPKELSTQLLLISYWFKNITADLKMGAETASKVKDIFAGFFAVVSIGWEIIKGFASVFMDVVKAIAPAGGGFLTLGANVGEFLVHMKEVLVDGGKIHDFFQKLGEVIVIPITFIQELISKIKDFFSIGAGNEVISGTVDRIGARFEGLSSAADKVSGAWQTLMDRLQPVFNVFDKIWEYIKTWFSELGQKIADVMKPADFNSVLDIINVGLLAGIAVMLKKFFAGGVKFGFGGGFITTIQNSLRQVNNSLKLMQTNLKAEALLKIAAALAIMVASIVVLSLIDSAALTKALAAMAAGFTELGAMLLMLDKAVTSIGGATKIGVLAFALTGLAAAMLILSVSVKVLGDMPFGDLVKGLIGIGVGMEILVKAVNAISKDTAGMVSAGVAMAAIAIALLILSEAVKSFGSMSWTEMAKGLIGVAVGLGLIVVAMNSMPATSLLTGLAFAAVATGLLILSQAVQAFGNMSWEAMAKGLLGLAVSLGAITVAMNFMPPNMPATATGLLILSVAMNVMASAVKAMGSLDMETLAKGVGGLAATLLVLVVAMNAMQGTIAGATALVIVSGAMLIFSEVLQKLGGMSIKEIAIGLGALAAVFIVLGVAALVLEPLTPAILGLGLALGVVGVAFALFGGAVLALAAGLQILAVTGVAGMAAFVKSLEILAKAIPELAAAAALFVVHFVDDLLAAMPTFVKLITALLEQILETIIKETPKIAKALETIIIEGLKLIQATAPLFVETGFVLLTEFLRGIRDNIVEITNVGVEIMVNFIGALINNMPMIVSSATQLIVSFLTELANHAAELVTAGVNVLVSFLQGIADNLSKVVDAVGNIVIAFVTALGNKAGDVVTAGVNVVIKFIEGLAQNAVRLADGAFKVVTDFLNGLASVIENRSGDLRAAGIRLVVAIIEGVTGADLGGMATWLSQLPGKMVGWVGDVAGEMWHVGRQVVSGIINGLEDAAGWLASTVWSWIKRVIPWPIKKALGIESPSKVTYEIGTQTGQGLINGLLSMVNPITDASSSIGNKLTEGLSPDSKALKASLTTMLDDLSSMDNFNPVITPVLDLTKVQLASADIQKFMKVPAITADVSLQQAGVISNANAALAASAATPTPTGPTQVTFEQTINAPEALSTNDIYRSTRSQIALAKKELDLI